MMPKLKYIFYNKWMLCFALLCCFWTMNAQSGVKAEPYELRLKLELPILATSGVGIGTAWYIKTQTLPLSTVQLAALSSSDIPDFDRRATRFWAPKLKTASDISAAVTIAAPLLLLLDEPIRKDYRQVIVMGVETFLLADMLTSISKVATKRSRPYAYNDSGQVPIHLQKDRDARFSFFSRPVSQASAMSFYTAKVYIDYHPNTKYKELIWTGAATLPLVTAALRYRSGEEFPSDLIMGYLIGAGVGLLVPWLHKKRKEKASRIN